MTETSNVTPFPARRVASRPVSLNPFIYPEEWQDVCRKLLISIAIHKGDRKLGTSIGMTALRRMIMADYDRVIDHTLVEDDRLSRQNLESFVTGNRRLSPPKFAFIDLFIRSIQFDPEYSDVLADVIAASETRKRAALCELYQGRKTEGLERSIGVAKRAAGKLYALCRVPEDQVVAPLNLLEFPYVGLVILQGTEDILRAAAIYAYVPIDKLLSGQAESRFEVHTGYYIPTGRYDTVVGFREGALLLFRYENSTRDGPLGKGGVSHTVSIVKIRQDDLAMSATWEPNVFTPNNENYTRDTEYIDMYKAFNPPIELSFLEDSIRNLTPEYTLW